MYQTKSIIIFPRFFDKLIFVFQVTVAPVLMVVPWWPRGPRWVTQLRCSLCEDTRKTTFMHAPLLNNCILRLLITVREQLALLLSNDEITCRWLICSSSSSFLEQWWSWHFACLRSNPITVQLSSLKCKEMPSSKKDKNGNEISQETEEEKQNRINRNMAKFLSMEKQQQQLVLCLRQQQMPKNLLQMGALRKTTVACNFNLMR